MDSGRRAMAGTSLLVHMSVPDAYGIVEPGVYRSNVLAPHNLPFLLHLHLRTVVYLSPDPPQPYLTDYLRDNGITFLHMGCKFEKPTVTWKPISEDLIKDGLEVVLDVNTHPIMIMCQTGVHVTGTVVGCLRRLQKWNLTSLLEEYRRYAGSKARYANEQFMELFDEDLVTLPESLPPWFIDQMKMMEDEEEEFQKELQKQIDGEDDTQDLNHEIIEERLSKLKATSEAPNYKRFFYTRSTPLTTEDRSYKRKIIGKVGS